MAGSKLLLAGALTLLTGVNVIAAPAEIDMQGGKLTADTLHLAGMAANTGIMGAGTVSVDGDMFIQSAVISDNIAGHCRSGVPTLSASHRTAPSCCRATLLC